MWPWKSPSVDVEPELRAYIKAAPEQAAPGPRAAVPKREVATVGKSAHQAAMDNCIEFEKAFSACLQSGKYVDRVGSCQAQKHTHDKCVQLQTQVLAVMGYSQASLADKRRIKGEADDLMIEKCPSLEISPEQEASVVAYLESNRHSN